MKISIFSFSFLAAFLLLNSNASGQSAVVNRNAPPDPKTGITAADNHVPENQLSSDKIKIQSGNGRGCTPVYRSNPYSISRKDFEQLPPDRQKFVLNNPDKYPITD